MGVRVCVTCWHGSVVGRVVHMAARRLRARRARAAVSNATRVQQQPVRRLAKRAEGRARASSEVRAVVHMHATSYGIDLRERERERGRERERERGTWIHT
jgi:type IV secretory pathway TrbF-like protein